MDAVPVELAIQIIALAIYVHPQPANVLAVNSRWHLIGRPVLTDHIQFNSLRQITTFVERWPNVAPKSVVFTRHITTVEPRLFHVIAAAFVRMDMTRLERVRMRLNSHITGAAGVHGAMKLINPKSFEWTSPDPDHQISISIVSEAVGFLSSAIARQWSNLVHIKLTNMTCEAHSIFTAFSSQHPHLRYICLAQSVHVAARDIVAALARLPGLERLELIDVYKSSIWERRLRMDDLKGALEWREEAPWAIGEEEGSLAWDDVRAKVRCLVDRQRLDGGDKGEDMDQA